jgi:hypothetical protein
VVATKSFMTNRDEPGSIEREVDVTLLSLVSSGCTVEQLVGELGLPLGELHSRLVKLRRFIEHVSRTTPELR